MIRVFLEEPTYKCRVCLTEIGVPTDISSRINLGSDGLFCVFTRAFNTYLLPSEPGFVWQKDIHCVHCRNIIGRHLPNTAGNYYILRNRLHGPAGSDHDGNEDL